MKLIHHQNLMVVEKSYIVWKLQKNNCHVFRTAMCLKQTKYIFLATDDIIVEVNNGKQEFKTTA